MEVIMNRNILAVFLILAVLCGPVLGADTFTPVISTGDWWEVEVIQKNMFNNEEKWCSPFVLKYTVTKEDPNDYYIDISEVSEGIEIGQLVIQKDGFQMKTVYYYRRIQGELQQYKLDFDSNSKSPVISEVSFIPYSLPVFPLKKGNSEDLMESVPQKESFQSLKSFPDGDLKFKRNFSQQTVKSDVLVNLESDEAVELIEEVGEDKLTDGYYVTVKDSFLGEKVEQLWKKGYPWFLYSRNSNVKAKLLRHSVKSEGGDK